MSDKLETELSSEHSLDDRIQQAEQEIDRISNLVTNEIRTRKWDNGSVVQWYALQTDIRTIRNAYSEDLGNQMDPMGYLEALKAMQERMILQAMDHGMSKEQLTP